MKSLGRHLLVEYYGCDSGVINDLSQVEKEMKQAARQAGSTIVDSVFRRFAPHGVSGVVVIAESHLAVHTWPEYGYAAVDLFTCGESVEPRAAHDYLKDAFHAEKSETREVLRGEARVLGDDIRHKPGGSLGPVPPGA